MAICPHCQTEIEIGSEFYGGLFTCPACRAVYFISFDGVPESPEGASVPQASSAQELSPTPTVEPLNPSPAEFLTQPSEPMVTFDAFPPFPGEGESVSSPEVEIKNPLQEVVDFANRQEASPLVTYTLEISGLDLSQNVKDFKDILLDSKLKLSFDEVKVKIKNGQLRLEKLDAAQASILAFRLRALNMEMKWEQVLT